jgi:hypothetical protein
LFGVFIEELHNVLKVFLEILGLVNSLDLFRLCYQSAESHQHMLKLILVTTVVQLGESLHLLVSTGGLVRLEWLEVWACLLVIPLGVEAHILLQLNIVVDVREGGFQDGSLESCAFWDARSHHRW